MYKNRLDYVELSFVQKPEDVKDLLDLFAKLAEEETNSKAQTVTAPSEKYSHEWEMDAGVAKSDLESNWRPLIISKIEKPQALDEIDDIINISDGIMVARGDLGVECSLEQVPIIQKTLIRKTNNAFKPIITATQMLESMISSPVPTCSPGIFINIFTY